MLQIFSIPAQEGMNKKMCELKFRYARKNDTDTIMKFISELARFEGLEEIVDISEETLIDWVFIRNKAEIIIPEVDSTPIGFCLFFHNFSTFIGHAGVYIEDLYISPEYRGKGYGKLLFKKIAQIAVDRGCKKLELSCPNWNLPGIEFHKHMGIKPMDKWTTYRVSDDELRTLCEAD